jgi:glycosyltransferase involved in cell wall biosynthesis
MTNIILSNVSLCAIVRDEIMNPAGGIADFLECHMPFVGAGAVIDTGSLDGTREALERARGKYPQIRVYDHRFRDFADARNHSLAQVQTPYALVLDADERLSKEDFERLKEILNQNPDEVGFKLLLEEIREGSDFPHYGEHNPRLFRADKGFLYINQNRNAAEHLHIPEGKSMVIYHSRDTDVKIKHFLPECYAGMLKYADWYSKLNGKEIPAPSQTQYFSSWKKFNPQRANFHFGLDDKFYCGLNIGEI